MPKHTFKSKAHAKKVRTIIGASLVFGFLTLTLLIVTQLPKIQEFISRANAEPANIVVNANAIIGPLPRPWRNLAQGGESHDWRIQPIQQQVSALKPEYIRIDHIYDFYDIVQGTPGNLQFDFTKFDVILDDILATGAKPYISLSYTPPAIASGDIISEPVSYADWQLTVQKTIEHVSGTKGISDVYYEVWNEPDLFGSWKYYGDKNYMDLYNASSRGARNAKGVQRFKLGGPATTALYKNWFDAMAKNAINTNAQLDFISWHKYTRDVDDYRKDMTQARTWLSKYPQLEATVELHITEWGHDSENDPGYDTAFGAAHTVASSIEMIGIIERAFVFEIQDGKDPNGNASWGRWGLLQHQDFGSAKKPRYHAMQFMDSLGDSRVQLLGKGTYVKAVAARKNENNYQILLANYDKWGRNAETVPITVQNLPPGAYTVTKTALSGTKQQEKINLPSGSDLVTTMPMPPLAVGMVEITRE